MKIAQVAVVFALLLLVAVALFAQTSSSPAYSTQTFDASTMLISPQNPQGLLNDVCTGAAIKLTGTIVQTTAVWVDQNSVTHIRENENFKVSGVDQNQLTYSITGAGAQIGYDTTDLAPQVEVMLTRMTIIGPGAVPNEKVMTMNEVTVAATGTATGSIPVMETVCPGN